MLIDTTPKQWDISTNAWRKEFSNFTPCWVTLNWEDNSGDTHAFACPTTEHAYQAAKVERIEDVGRIIVASSPGMAKRMGRTAQMKQGWDTQKYRVMEELLRDKFSKPHFSALLATTGNTPIIEVTYWNDLIWGTNSTGWGANALGQLLMGIRRELRGH